MSRFESAQMDQAGQQAPNIRYGLGELSMRLARIESGLAQVVGCMFDEKGPTGHGEPSPQPAPSSMHHLLVQCHDRCSFIEGKMSQIVTAVCGND